MAPNAHEIAKARRDPYFLSVIERYGADALQSASFFDDGAEVGVDMAKSIDPHLPATSLDKILARLSSCQENFERLAVVITSGGFCPIHAGHLAMMESAKATLEHRGIGVAGGFIAPDHDTYIRFKCGNEAIPGYERVELVREAIRGSEWLEVDPWAALYLDRAVNFTDIIRRMEIYLRAHIVQPLEVFFVCGSDNAGFARAFTERGGLVIVPRGDTSLRFMAKSLGERIVVCEDAPRMDLSSRSIRATPAWREERDKNARERLRSLERARIKLRDEGDWAIEHWVERYGDAARRAYQEFIQGLSEALREAFVTAHPMTDVRVESVAVSLQRALAQSELRETGIPTISLDPCVEMERNVAPSRLFSVTASVRQPGLRERPGAAPLVEQIAQIPPGEYSLLDDDIATGRTIREFMELLPLSIRIRDVHSVYTLTTGDTLNTVEGTRDRELAEIGDARDFLLGARDGGLVVRLFNGAITRVPYLLPYVRTTSRMSIPVRSERLFSLRVWELNLRFHSSLPELALVGECSESFRAFAASIGFSDDDSLVALCDWHVTQLMKASGSKSL